MKRQHKERKRMIDIHKIFGTTVLLLAIGILPACSGKERGEKLSSDSRLAAYLYNQRVGQTVEQSALYQDQREKRQMLNSFGNDPFGARGTAAGVGGARIDCSQNPQLCIRSQGQGGSQIPPALPSGDTGSQMRGSAPSLKVVTRQDPPLAVAKGFCEQIDYDTWEDPEGLNDWDQIPGVCEMSGLMKGFRAMDPRTANVYKIAAVSVPREKRNIFASLASMIFTPNRDWITKNISLAKMREWLEAGEEKGFRRIQVYTEHNDGIRLPRSNEVGVVTAGNRKAWLTLGGVSGSADTDEAFSVAKLPGVASNNDSLDRNDAFIYMVEASLSFPESYDPVFKIVEAAVPGRETKEAGGIVVFINGKPVVHTFKKKHRMGEDHQSQIAPFCPTKKDCHMVAMLYSPRWSNSSGDLLREALLIDVNANDDRGFEPLPSEIARPYVPKNYQYADGAGPVIRLLADPALDADLVSTCQHDIRKVHGQFQTEIVDGKEVVDLTNCQTLFFTDDEGEWAKIWDQVQAFHTETAADLEDKTGQDGLRQLDRIDRTAEMKKAIDEGQAGVLNTMAPERPDYYQSIIDQMEIEFKENCRPWNMDLGWFGNIINDKDESWCRQQRREIARYREALDYSKKYFSFRRFDHKSGTGMERPDGQANPPAGATDEFDAQYDYNPPSAQEWREQYGREGD